MKNSKFFKLTILGLLPIIMAGSCFSISKEEPVQTMGYSASSLPTTIDLNPSTDEEIRNYYSALNGKSTEQRQGNNLLKNLKPILKNKQQYFSYDKRKDDIWKAYEITDRDWDLSPAATITNGTYDAATNTITNYKYNASSGTDSNNPYLHALYVDRTKTNPMRAWGNHTQKYGGINQEHIWPKSHGFDTVGDGGARGDLMHLWAADGYSNNMHNNWAYGNVDPYKIEKKSVDTISYATSNYLGTSLTLGTGKVFEPQDSDKGDVARALFYMAARYNNFAGESNGIDSNDPYLILADYTVKEAGTSTATSPMKYGVLSDLLEWNKLDPVDEYEIRRNNLLFKNFTKNRNPFIDFPEWADAIWGDYDVGDGKKADPRTDVINNKKEEKIVSLESIEITSKPAKTVYYLNECFNPAGMIVTGTYEDGSQSVIKNFQYTSTPFTTGGKQNVTISYSNVSTQIEVEVIEKIVLDNGIYTIEFDTSVFDGGNSYEKNNHSKTIPIKNSDSVAVSNAYIYSNNVLKFGGMQFKKTGGVIYNTIPLWNITNIELTLPEKNTASFEINYGAELNPANNTNAGGRYFSIRNVDEKTGYIDKIKITFVVDNQPLMESIEIRGNYKTKFKVQEEFTSEGLKVYSKFENGAEKEETRFAVNPPSMDVSGNEEVEVSVVNNHNEIFTAIYVIEIENYAVGLVLEGTENVTFKYKGTFNHNGVSAYLSMKDGDREEVTSDCSFSKPSLDTIGKKSVTVTYSKNGYNFTTSYQIEVKNYVTEIELTGNYRTEFVEGETFNYDGLKVILKYADGSTETVSSGFTVTGASGELKIGEKTITVKYVSEGTTLKATYKITITENIVEAILDGCLGSIGSSLSIFAILTLVGFALILYKRKGAC